MKLVFILISIVSMLHTYAGQDQLGIKISDKGLNTILSLGLNYNNPKNDGLIIPEAKFRSELDVSEIKKNPVYDILTQISDLRLSDKLKYSLSHSSIKITSDLNRANTTLRVVKSSLNEQSIEVSVAFNRLSLKMDDFILCENFTQFDKGCLDGQAFRLNDVMVEIKSPIVFKILFKVQTSMMVTRISVEKTETNLKKINPDSMNLKIGRIQTPQVKILINGQSVSLSPKAIEQSILNRKIVLLSKLVNYTADFASQDLVEMLNKYLIHKEILAQWSYHYLMYGISLNEFIHTPQYRTIDPYKEIILPLYHRTKEQEIAYQFSQIVKRAQVGLQFEKVVSPDNRSLEIFSHLFFMLNDKRMLTDNRLGNSSRRLQEMKFSSQVKSDYSLLISEPMLNSALDLVSGSGFIQNTFYSLTKLNGISIENVKVHFFNTQSLSLVVNLRIDLKKIDSKSLVERIKKKIGVYLERNNNNSEIYFPLEIPLSLYPYEKNNRLSFYVHSPFKNKSLVNNFNYPSNLDKLSSLVYSGLRSEIEDSLGEFLNKRYDLDLAQYLDVKGVKFKVADLKVKDASVLELNLDLSAVDFKLLGK